MAQGRFEISNRQLLRAAFFEAVFVVLGVVLALLANSWRENRLNARAAERALASITDELRTNRDAVATAHEYHDQQLQVLAGQHPPDWRPGYEHFERGFIYVAPVFDAAYEAASSTGLFQHLPYETLLVLARVYSLQDQYEHQGRVVFPLIYGQLYEKGSSAILENYRGLASMITTFQYREQTLLEDYDQALAYLASAPIVSGDDPEEMPE